MPGHCCSYNCRCRRGSEQALTLCNCRHMLKRLMFWEFAIASPVTCCFVLLWFIGPLAGKSSMPFNVPVCQQYTVTDSWWLFVNRRQIQIWFTICLQQHTMFTMIEMINKITVDLVLSNDCFPSMFWRSNSAWCVVMRGHPVCKVVGIMLDRETKHILYEKAGYG